jgi:hypothetical protein
MSVVEAFDLGVVVPSIARRAVDLARDVRVPTDDGAEHLVRLVMGRRGALAAALVELGSHKPSSEVACAELLLARAIHLADDEARRPSS